MSAVPLLIMGKKSRRAKSSGGRGGGSAAAACQASTATPPACCHCSRLTSSTALDEIVCEHIFSEHDDNYMALVDRDEVMDTGSLHRLAHQAEGSIVSRKNACKRNRPHYLDGRTN